MEERVARVETQVDHIREDLQRIEKKIDDVAEDVDRRMAGINQRFEKVDERFEKVDQRFEKLEAKVEALKDSLYEFRLEMKDALAKIAASRMADRVWQLLVNGAMLGVMARGFKWI